jgi:hypothetical protein
VLACRRVGAWACRRVAGGWQRGHANCGGRLYTSPWQMLQEVQAKKTMGWERGQRHRERIGAAIAAQILPPGPPSPITSFQYGFFRLWSAQRGGASACLMDVPYSRGGDWSTVLSTVAALPLSGPRPRPPCRPAPRPRTKSTAAARSPTVGGCRIEVMAASRSMLPNPNTNRTPGWASAPPARAKRPPAAVACCRCFKVDRQRCSRPHRQSGACG